VVPVAFRSHGGFFSYAQSVEFSLWEVRFMVAMPFFSFGFERPSALFLALFLLLFAGGFSGCMRSPR
jgi:hypothetical protein